VANFIIILIQRSAYSDDYNHVFFFSSVLSVISLAILIFAFEEKRLTVTKSGYERAGYGYEEKVKNLQYLAYGRSGAGKGEECAKS